MICTNIKLEHVYQIEYKTDWNYQCYLVIMCVSEIINFHIA
jgi:hypothetical protein